MTSPGQSYAFRMQMECDECGYPVVLDGPGRPIECEACRAKVELPAKVWAAVLSQAPDDVELAGGGQRRSRIYTGGWWLTVSYRIAEPDPVPTWPVPPELQQLLPRLAKIHAAGDDKTENQDEIVAGGAAADEHPVALSCVQCGGNLRVDRASPRILNCNYCGTDYFLPESLWRHLHPVRRKPTWWVTFADPERAGAQSATVQAAAPEKSKPCGRCGVPVPAHGGYMTEHGLVCDRCFAG